MREPEPAGGDILVCAKVRNPEARARLQQLLDDVFFCNLPDRRIMMLHAFVKKSAKTPARHMKVARERMREVQADDEA